MMADDEMKMEDITPEMLGCLGEPECDPGIKEEAVGSGSAEKPKARCFESIPFEQRKLYHKFYHEFFEPDARDISFEEFAVELYALSSPMLMQQDLSKVMDQKHMGAARKQAIDRKVAKSMN